MSSVALLPTIQVVRLGRLGYLSALKVQKYFQKQHLLDVHEKTSDHTLLIVEHDPGLKCIILMSKIIFKLNFLLKKF